MSSPTEPVNDSTIHLVEDAHGARYETDVEEEREIADAARTNVPVEENSSLDPAYIDLIAPAPKHGRIIAGVDGTDASVDALRRAAQLAAADGTALTAITTWDFPSGYAGMVSSLSSPEEDAVAIADAVAAAVFGRARPDWFSISILRGKADHVLVEESRTADLLVVGTRGHAGIAGIYPGSVSAACAEHAKCPVLVMR